MDSTTNHPHYRSPDILKGFIIFAIVMVHIVLNAGQAMGGGEPALILQILYLGLMVFFIFSGYFYKAGTGFVHNMKKRVSQVLLALVLCSFIIPIFLWIWLAILGYQLDIFDYFDAVKAGFCLNNVFLPPGTPSYHPYCCGFVGYYFLWLMMWAFVIFYALIEFVLDDLKKIAAVIIALLVVQFLICYFIDVGLFMGLKEAPIAAAFMFLGFVLSKYNLIDTIEKMELRTKAFWLPFLVCLIAGLVLCFILHPGTGFDKASFGYLGAASVFPFFVEAGLMCVVYIYIAAFIAKIPILSKALEISGQHTMGILLYHGSIATAIFALFAPLSFDSWFPTLDFTTRLVIGIVTFVLCVIICVYGPKLITAIKDKKKDKVSS